MNRKHIYTVTERDPLSEAKGILIGVIVGLALWTVALVILWQVYESWGQG